MWEGLSTPHRQHIVTHGLDILDDLQDEVDQELVAEIIQDIAELEAKYPPGTTIWDDVRHLASMKLLQDGFAPRVVEMGSSIKNTALQQQLVYQLLERGVHAEALSLTLAMTDPKIMTETLLDGDWLHDDNEQILMDIIENTDGTQPVERRITCLEVMRERLQAIGDKDGANVFQIGLPRCNSQSK